MESEVDRLSGMVDSLLKLTNLEQVPRSDRIKLGELLHQAAEDVSPLAAKKGIAILSNTGRMADRHGSVRS